MLAQRRLPSLAVMQSSDPILVAYNARTGDRGPVEFGLAWSRLTRSPLVVQWVHGSAADAQAIDELRTELAGSGVEVLACLGRSAGAEITETAERLEAGMVVLGTTGRRFAKTGLLGTTAERVLQGVQCPVVVVPRRYTPPPDGIASVGVAYAGESAGRVALAWVAALPGAEDVSACAIQVVHSDADSEQRWLLLSALRGAITAVGERAEFDLEIRFGDPADVLVATAGRLDLLVMGSRQEGSHRPVALGSVSRQVAERSPCPVVVVPRAVHASAEPLLVATAAHGAPS
jgi:nucleotide-binding universal stress UspA family protein